MGLYLKYWFRVMKKDYCIIYAEDDEKIRTGYLNFLDMEFTRVYGASNGKEAYELYQEVKPDIIILDINMPIMDGLQVAKKIRKEDEKVKILMLTAYSDKSKLLQAIELNLFKYLIKPVSTFEFKDVLNDMVKNIEKLEDEMLIIDNEFKWNKSKKILYRMDEEMYLTKKEILLIDLFCSNPNTTYSNEDILNLVWEDEINIDFNTNKVRSLFSKLKSKIGANLFTSIYGVGYRLK